MVWGACGCESARSIVKFGNVLRQPAPDTRYTLQEKPPDWGLPGEKRM